MFNSNGFLLSKIIDSDEKDLSSIDIKMNEGKNKMCSKKIRQYISNLNLNDKHIFNMDFEEFPGNKRMQSIKAIMITECTYLKRIKELLTDMLYAFEQKFDKKRKNQFYTLLENFPTIYSLHFTLHVKMKEEFKNTKEIGNILLEFLSQPELLNVYIKYINNFSNSLEICKNIKERMHQIQCPELSQLEAIIMSPIQRFPQLSMAIGDIFKYTLDAHKDKALLFKAVSISKSITARLDRQRKEFECNNFSDIQSSLSKLKMGFTSNQLLTNNSVFDIRSDFNFPRKRIKIPYYLILCNNNVVMIPRNVPSSELSERIVFCFSLDELSFKQKAISDNNERRNSYTDFVEVKDMYHLINDSFNNDVIISDYEELLKDYKILFDINEKAQNLQFHYKGIDTLKVSKSLIQLEKRLKSKEVELNLQLGSILTLIINVPNSLEDKRVFLFDSIRQSNEWKMNFKRAKLLKNVDMTTFWKYYSFEKKLCQIKPNELPLLFPPFLLQDNGILNINVGISKCQSVALVVGLKIYRCLWLCLENGWVLILHFDYKKWNVLESFVLDKREPVNAICVSSHSNVGSPDHIYDAEIWLGCGDVILIYSLLDNQRSSVKKSIHLPSEVKSLCNVENKIFVALKSKKILIYSKSKEPFWLQETEITLKKFLTSYTEELKDLYYGHGFIYILFKSKIIIYKYIESIYNPLKVFESNKEITTMWITSEGVWISLRNVNELKLYDKCMENTYQNISLPLVLYKTYNVGYITTIYMDERYIWLGTERGFIINISTIDSMYCSDSKIPMYFSSKCSVGPITQLTPFQNIHGVTVRCPSEDFTSKKEMFDQMLPSIRRSISSPPIEDAYLRPSYSCHNISKCSKEDLYSSSNSSLHCAIETLKSTTPVLIIAFGCGIANYVDKSGEEEKGISLSQENSDHPVMFTFLE